MGLRHAVVNGKLRHLHSWRKDRPDHRDFKLTAPAADVAPLPPSTDVSAVMPPVQDQSSVGSCVGNGCAEVCDALQIKNGKPLTALSRLMIYAGARWREGVPLTEDSGCQIRDAMKFLAFFGTCREELWPYDISKYNQLPPHDCFIDAAERKITTYHRCDDIQTMKQSLVEGFPVVFGFSVPRNFTSPECAKTGILTYPSPDEAFVGGHCVVVIGYDDGRGALLCRNSWGEGWGLGGNFWMPYDFVVNGLADDAWTVREELGS